MFRYIFSIAFIFTLCLFWMQIQLRKCEDDLQFWVRDTKYWTTTTKQWSVDKRDTNSETEVYSPRRQNEKSKKYSSIADDGTFIESEMESNQVNSVDKIDDYTQPDKPDNLLYWRDSESDHKKRSNQRTFKHIRYSKKKGNPHLTHSIQSHKQPRDRRPHSSYRELKTVNKHNGKNHTYSVLHTRDNTLKPGEGLRTHSQYISTPMYFEENSQEKYNWKPIDTKNKANKHGKEHKSKVSKNHVKAPLIAHSTYKEVKKTAKSDLGPETTVKPVTEAKSKFETEASDEFSTESKTKPIFERKTEPALESVFETKMESAFETTTQLAFKDKNEKDGKFTIPLRGGADVMTKDNGNSSSSSESNSKEHDVSEEKPIQVIQKNIKWPGRSPLHKPEDSSQSKHKGVGSLEYLSPHSIKRQLTCLAKKFESRASIDQEVIGRTIEYNDIILWKIKELPDNRKGFKHKTYRYRARGSKYADDKPEKKIVFIVHGLNVMGWHKIKCLSQVKRFETLLGYYIDNLDCFDIFLIPMANPDGVHMSGTQGYWNKNVSPQKACPGVNLDRNFDIGWNASYAKTSSCSQQYPGPRSLSEHETKAIRDILNRYGHKMIAFFHVHSSTYDTTVYRGDAVLYPKGYTDTQTDDDRYVDFKGELEEAMRNTSFKVLGVTVDTLYSWYGKAMGTSVDYASTVFGIPYSFDFSMQIYDDDTTVTKEDDREQNTALVELWQIIIDVVFSHIHNNTEKIE